MERLVEPPEVKHERLLVVSILGFLVNLVGIFVFQVWRPRLTEYYRNLSSLLVLVPVPFQSLTKVLMVSI